MSHPFDSAARRSHLDAAAEDFKREAHAKLLEAEADQTSRGIARVGFHPVCMDVVRMWGGLVDSALEFDEAAKAYELKRLEVHKSCENPFSEAREAKSLEFIENKIDTTADWIRPTSPGKRLWSEFSQQHWDSIRLSEKSSVRRRLKHAYRQRRAEFKLDVQQVAQAGEVVGEAANAGEHVIVEDGGSLSGTDNTVLPSAGQVPKLADKVREEIDYEQLLAIKNKIDPKGEYIGTSVAILRVFEKIEDFNKRPEEPVLILGPTGAGKTEIAELIHSSSKRGDHEFQQFDAPNALASDRSLIRSDWLGYGPKSGIANSDPKGRDGLLKTAADGTIFIDEVAELPEWFQRFLFPVLPPRKEVTPISGDKSFTPNVRLIFATNKDIYDTSQGKPLLHDFLRRIKDNELRIPPLSERIEDVLLFAEKKCGDRKRSAGFLLCLLRYAWPGNVGELLGVLNKVVSRTSKDVALTTEHLELADASLIEQVTSMSKDKQEQELVQFVYKILRQQGYEKGRLGAGLGNRVADLLGVSAQTAGRLLKKHVNNY